MARIELAYSNNDHALNACAFDCEALYLVFRGGD